MLPPLPHFNQRNRATILQNRSMLRPTPFDSQAESPMMLLYNTDLNSTMPMHSNTTYIPVLYNNITEPPSPSYYTYITTHRLLPPMSSGHTINIRIRYLTNVYRDTCNVKVMIIGAMTSPMKYIHPDSILCYTSETVRFRLTTYFTAF